MLESLINKTVKKVLLVYPSFPIPAKSRNNHNLLPIGLLKIGSYFRSKGIDIKLVKSEEDYPIDFDPQLICISSIFTYWSKYVKESVMLCRHLYPNAKIVVGGIYASLMPEHCKKYTKCDIVLSGVMPEAEKVVPAYDLVDVDYQIIHTSRGCIRNCSFCGVTKVEPKYSFKKSIKDEILKKKVIIYDNNILANPYFEDILDELIELKNKRVINYVESQSGFDGRILLKKPHIVPKLKKAGFKNPRIAWDNSIDDENSIYEQLRLFFDAGYSNSKASVFMVYNFDIPYEQMEYKRTKCFEWGVIINPCRYRPLTSTYDNYNGRKKHQTSKDYYIHPNWTDYKVRTFTKNCRRTNVCTMFNRTFFSEKVLRKRLPDHLLKKYSNLEYSEAKKFLSDAWDPSVCHSI